MDQIELQNTPKHSKVDHLSKEDLLQRIGLLEFEIRELVKEIYELRGAQLSESQLKLIIQEQLDSLQDAVYGRSSERYKKPEKKKDDGSGDEPKVPAKPRVKKPSERYPNIPVRTELITQDPAPACPCCNQVMTDSGMTEDSEQLTVIPKKYEIVVQKKVKFRCQCQGAIVTAPTPARIAPGSSYSDEMILDVALSKYCDLIPIGRYAAMAGRGGLMDLPPQSLIETTHTLADFVSPVYSLIKKQLLAARVLQADETPHRMLEGDEKRNWQLWGFSTAELCYLECRNTRSGDVASQVLAQSQCEILLTDVYSGYGKAVRLANELRIQAGGKKILNAHCNAHARRPFFKLYPKYPEAQYYLDQYHEIYRLNDQAKGLPPPLVKKLREEMRPIFEAMKVRAMDELPRYPEKGKYGGALRYFLGNYEGLTLFLTDAEVPIDNNSQEGLLRNPVVGRKTWYGTHSKRGALTAAILFSLVESCKMNQVNPREYFEDLVEDLLLGASPYTPRDYKLRKALAS